MDITTASGLITIQYGPRISEIVADEFPLMTDEYLPFEAGNKVGASFRFPVFPVFSHNFTENADGSVATLNTPTNTSSVEASVTPYSTVLREFLSYAVLSRIKGGAKKYDPKLSALIGILTRSLADRRETNILYGQSSLGATTEVAASGTVATLTLSAASWAPGIWAGKEGATIDVFATTASASPTNANGALTITAIDRSTRVITATCAAADAAALDALTTSVIYWRSVKTGPAAFLEGQGLDAMISAATIHGISTSSYSLWKPESFAVGGNLTLSKVHQGMSLIAAKGGAGDACLFVSPKTWTYLQSEFDTLARYPGSSENKRSNGAKAVAYMTQTGPLKVLSHAKVKEGEAFAMMKRGAGRIGSMDLGLGTPSLDGNRTVLLDRPDSMGAELRMFTDQVLKLENPGHVVKFTGITNS